MAKELKLSATKINTFLQCKQRYWFSYEEKLEKLSNSSFKFGLACHEALEAAGKLWKENNLTKFSSKQIDTLLKVYDKSSVKHGIENHEDHQLGRELVKSRLLNFKVGDFIVGIEDRFGFENELDIKTSKGVPLIGAIDKSVELDKDTLLIVDYKTSRTAPDANKLRSDVQLSMYDLVARQLYPKYKKIILCLDMLRTQEMIYTYRTQEERDLFEDYLLEIYTQMKELKKEDALPSINPLCAWCDHTNICEKYQELKNKKEYDFLNVNTLTDSEIIAEWESIKTTQKILDLRENELSDIIYNKLKFNEEAMISENKELVLRQRSKITYDAKKLSVHIPIKDFASLVTVSSSKLKKYAEKNPSIMPILDDIGETNFSGSFIAIRKTKNTKD